MRWFSPVLLSGVTVPIATLNLVFEVKMIMGCLERMKIP